MSARTWRSSSRLAFGMLLITALIIVALPSDSMAQNPPTPWRAEYFDNQNLVGNPVLVRQEASINYEWGNSSPGPNVPSDHFSARWTALLMFEESAYTFRAYADDGIRVCVDGVVLIHDWTDHAPRQYEAAMNLSAGYHSVRVDFYDNIGAATAKVWWDRGQPSTPSAATPAPGPTTWRAEYFDNEALQGAPVRVQMEDSIEHRFGHGAPVSGVRVDHFSARWTADKSFEEGTYSFKAYVDDGVRLWVDGQLIMDEWRNQVATLFERNVTLSAGLHNIRMEYYENIGEATAILWWVRIAGPAATPKLRAEYFNNPWLIGPPVVVREESAINYNFGRSAPVPEITSDKYSIRWTGDVEFAETGTYTFTATSDDGVRVCVDGGLLIDQWKDQSATTVSATRQVTKGMHPVLVEYYNAGGDARIQVFWQRSGAGPTPTPVSGPTAVPGTGSEIIVDDRDSAFQRSGPTQSWFEYAVGYKGHTYWTYNSASHVANSARWVPNLPRAGNYQVYAFIPRLGADTTNAQYRINHNGQQHTFRVNQSVYFDRWVSLGTYYFSAAGGENVSLDDVTGETYGSRKIGFDAMRFVLQGGSSPAPNPTATPVPSGCAITPVLGFGAIWSGNNTVRTKLGCAVQTEKYIWSAEQPFIGGYMFWRSDLSLIYALYNNGTWQSFIDTWNTTMMESDPTITPPSGYYQPRRGFGKIWREQAGARDKLGWATANERGLGAAWQPFQNGLMLWSDVHGTFVIYSDGTWRLFD